MAKKLGLAASLLGAVSLCFSPVFHPAFASGIASGKLTAADLLGRFTPAGIDARLAAKFGRGVDRGNAIEITNNRFSFTPAGIKVEGRRTMTIAARTDSPLSSQAVTIRSALRTGDFGSSIGLVKSDFRLTAAKGWKGFSAPVEQKTAVRAPIISLDIAAGNFRLDDKAPAKKSRFNADVRVDQNRNTVPLVNGAASGSASGNAAVRDYGVDLEGSFSLSKRVAVTAGVRYQSERERIPPLVEDRNDSEAVYVGTKIRF